MRLLVLLLSLFSGRRGGKWRLPLFFVLASGFSPRGGGRERKHRRSYGSGQRRWPLRCSVFLTFFFLLEMFWLTFFSLPLDFSWSRGLREVGGCFELQKVWNASRPCGGLANFCCTALSWRSTEGAIESVRRGKSNKTWCGGSG